ncbi:MAG: hypothetical protein J6Y92_03215 [Lentisphaeria bacterium]|nr:hypothetical protein [Lentisphaeria bacterium]
MLYLNNAQHERFDKALADYAEGRPRGCFELNEAAQAIADGIPCDAGQEKDLLERVRTMLKDDHRVFEQDGHCALRTKFFNGARFKIAPSDFELTNGILLPGDRFEAFNPCELASDEFELYTPGAKNPVELTAVRSDFGKLAPYYLLLGHGGMIDAFAAESHDNYLRMRSAKNIRNAVLEVPAFDLSAFYMQTNFRPGDFLVVTVEDAEHGRFSLEYRPAELDASSADKIDWIEQFEAALIDVWHRNYDYITITEQLAAGFFRAYCDGNDLLAHPRVSFDEFHRNMIEVTLSNQDGETMIVPLDETNEPGADAHTAHDEHDHEHEHGHEHAHGGSCSCGHHDGHGEHDVMHGEHRDGTPRDGDPVPGLSASDFSASSGHLDSLDAILSDVNAPIGFIELYAFTLDAIANGVDFNSYRASILGLIEHDFADDTQEVAFLNFLDENWEACNEIYHPGEDEAKAPFRARLIELDNARIAMTRAVLSGADENRIKRFVPRLKHFHRAVIDTLALLNNQADLPEGPELEAFEQRIEDIEDEWDAIEADFEN